MGQYSGVYTARQQMQAVGASTWSVTNNYVQSNLIVYFDATSASSYSGSGSTWYDLSGNNNNGTLYNTPTFSSGSAGYMQFNGSNQYMQANIGTTALDGNPVMSIEYLCNVTADYTGSGFWGVGGAGQSLSVEGWGPNTRMIHWDSYDSTRLDTGLQYTVGSWFHVVWSKTAGDPSTSTVTAYVNNVARSLTLGRSQTSTLNMNTSSAGKGVSLGRINGDYNGYYAPVKIGLYRVYSKALSAAEVTQNYNTIKTAYGLS